MKSSLKLSSALFITLALCGCGDNGDSVSSKIQYQKTNHNARHAKTLSDKVIEELEKHGVSLYHHEGYTLGKWILLDFTDVVVHIMQQEERDFYSIEKLWAMTETTRAKTL